MKKRGGEKQRTMNAPSAASLSANLQKDFENSIAVEEALEISSAPLGEIASIAPSSPPEPILQSDISSATCSLPSGVSNNVDSLDKVLAEQREKKAAPATQFPEDADELSKRISAAVSKAIEENAAAQESRSSGINLNSLLRMSAATLLVLICATSTILISMMPAYSMAPGTSLDFPPPT